MRTLSAQLTAVQKSRYIERPLYKIVLTDNGNTYTYTTNILSGRHTEMKYTHKAQIFLDDNDAVIHGIDLEGFKGVLSYGANVSGTDYYDATPPLWVVGQQRDSHQDRTIVSLELVGVMDLLGKDHANASYSQDSDDANTIKDLLDGIAGGTLAPFDHLPAVTITYDTGYDGGDNLINNFVPADYFSVNLGDTRLQTIVGLVGWTNNVVRVETDGELHILKPVTSGASYDYEYRLDDTYHNFLSKRFRRRVVFPNKIIVQNHPNQGEYTGNATSSTSYGLIPKERTVYARGTSNAQCTNIAEALIAKAELDAEQGSARLHYMNFGAEVHDYVNIVDSRISDNRAGNMSWLTRNFGNGKLAMDFGFGKPSLIPLNDLAPLGGGGGAGGGGGNIAAIYDYLDQIVDLLEGMVTIESFNQWYSDFISDAWFRKLTVVEQLLIPTWV